MMTTDRNKEALTTTTTQLSLPIDIVHGQEVYLYYFLFPLSFIFNTLYLIGSISNYVFLVFLERSSDQTNRRRRRKKNKSEKKFFLLVTRTCKHDRKPGKRSSIIRAVVGVVCEVKTGSFHKTQRNAQSLLFHRFIILL